MIPRRPNSIQDTRNRDELEILAGLRGSTDQHALRRGMLREVEARIAEITAQANRLASQIASAGELAARRGQDLDAEDQRRRDLRELRAEDRRISERVDEEISEAIDEIIIARQEIEAIEDYIDSIEIDIVEAEQIVTTVEALRDENIAYKNASEAAKTAAELARDGSEAARQVSETARDAAETAQGLAEDAHTAAASARDDSEAFRNAAQAARDAAQAAKDLAEDAHTAAASARDSSEAFRDASQAARTASELARDQAQAKAAEADGSAQAASGHAQTAETHATDASQSATAAQAFSVSASLTATQLLPSDFSEGDRYWSSSWSGTPGEKSRNFPEANWEFTEVDGVPMAVFTAPTSASRTLSTQGHLSVVEGRRYRMSIHARHVGPFVGGSDTFRVYFYRILSDFSSSGAHSSGTRSFSSSDQWETFTVDTTADGTVPFLNPFIQFREDRQGQPGPVIQIRAIVTEDITESENAAGHASAASDFAQSASVHADDAGQSAAAALGWRNQAETAAGQAETYRDEAATSETNAAGSASTATTQAGVATQAANNAGDSASAAASSASSASSSANEAGQQASAATTARTGAETARGGAETAATNASQSAEDADGHRASAANSASAAANSANTAGQAANAASGHAQTAESHADDASQSATAAQAFSVAASASRDSARDIILTSPVAPINFQNGTEYWTNSRNGNPLTVANSNGELVTDDPVFGTALDWVPSGSSGPGNLLTKTLFPWGGGKVYRVTLRFRVISSESSDVSIGVQVARTDDTYTASSNASSGSQPFPIDGEDKSLTAIVSDRSGPGIDDSWPSDGLPWVRFGWRHAQGGQSNLRLASCLVEDITSEYEALQSANAASDFAQAASAYADDAGQSAAATLGWRNEAQTAAGQAETYRDEAATSESNAAGSASTATTQAGVATQAANNAGQSATAAAGSASSASSSATEAGQQAAAATTARTGAETARGGAETAASNASQSAEDADGHRASAANSASAAANSANTAGQAANAASGHAQTAESHADDASQSATAAQAFSVAASASRDSARDIVVTSPIAPSDFNNGTEYWTGSREGSPTTVSSSGYTVVEDDPVFGVALHVTPSTTGNNVLTKGVFPWGSGRVYRVTLRLRVLSAESDPANPGIQVVHLDENYGDAQIGTMNATSVSANGEEVVISGIASDRSGPGIDRSTTAGGRPWVRFGWRHNTPGTSQMRLASCLVEDITSEYEALQSVNATSDLVQAVEAYVDDIEQSATAIFGWRNEVNTWHGDAESWHSEIVTAVEDLDEVVTTVTQQAGIATAAAGAAGGSAEAAAGSASTANSRANDAEQASEAAQAFSVSANLGLNSTSKLLVTRPIPELMAFGNTYAGLPENYSYRDPGHSLYGTDEGGPYLSQNTNTSNNYIGHRALVSVNESSVLRIKFTAKKSPAVNLRMRLFFISGPGNSDYLRVVNVNVPMPNDETVGTHTIVFAREALTGVTDTGGNVSDWNDCIGVRVTLNNSNGVSDGYFQLYGLEVEDIAAEIQANAASEFTQSAAAHADDVGQSAAAILGWRNQAQTAAGHAEGYAESAATSASNAAGSASTANQRAGLSVSATQAARPSTFESGFIGWGRGGGGSPNTIDEPSSQWSVSTGAGEVRVNDLPGSSQLAPHWLMQRGVIAVSPGDSVRISATWRTSGAGSSSEDGAALRWEWLDADYNTVGSSTFSTQSANNTSFEVRSDVREAPAGAVFCRIGIYVRSVWGSSSKTFRVIRVDGENITSEVRADASAYAAFQSEEAAYASAGAAGQSAGAAALSALNAGTSLTNAELAREDAVQAAEDADGSARSSAASLLRVRSSLNTSGIIDHFIGTDEDGNDVPSLEAFWRVDSGTPNNIGGTLSSDWYASTNRDGEPAARLSDAGSKPDTRNWWLANRGVLAVEAGDTIEVYSRISGAGSGSTGNIILGVMWLDSSYTFVSYGSQTLEGPPNAVVDRTIELVAPTNARYARPYIRHVAAGWVSRSFEVARLGAHNITRVTNAQAQADAAYTVATDTESSLAQITQTVTAEYGSWSAFATDTATAVATIDTIAARRTLGVSAGSNEASLTLLAWDDAGDGGSGIKLSAQNIILDGTVSARHLVISSTDNMILNAELDNLDGWDVDSDINGPFTTPTDMVSRRSVTINSGISSNTYLRWPTTVEAGRSYYMSMEVRNTGGSSYSRLRFYIQWYDRNNNNFANSSGTTFTKTTVSPEIFRESFVAPAGAVRARFLFGRLSHASNNGTTHIGSPVVRLMNDGQLTVDGSIAARHMDVESLAADSAFIANLNITEANISGDFTSDNYAESGGAPTAGFKLERNTGLIKGVGFIDRRGAEVGAFTGAYSEELIPDITEASDLLFPGVELDTSWQTLGSTGDVFEPAGGSVLINVSGNTCLGTVPAYIRIQVLRNGGSWETVAFRVAGFAVIEPSTNLFIWHSTFDASYAAPNGTNSLNVRVQARRFGGNGSGTSRASIFGLRVNATATRR